MKNQRFLFYCFNVIVFFFLNLHNIVFLRPQSAHQWRQCDSAAYSLNYFQNPESNFFFPQAMTLLGYKMHVISEFPILYWITGKLYGIFGYHEYIARLVTYSVFLLGVIFLFELGLRLFKQKWYAFLPVLLLYSSPCFIYYALNFLPNIPAFGLSLVAYFLFFRYLEDRQYKTFLYCSVAAFFAILLKPIEAFNYLAIVGILFFEYLRFFGLKRQDYDKKQVKSLLFTIFVVFYLNYAWINYVKGYAVAFGYGGNLLGILPIWIVEKSQIFATIDTFKSKWMYQLLWNPAFYVLGLLLLFSCYFFKRINRYLFLMLIFSILAQIAYVILFFDTFYNHDYYMLNIFIVPTLIVMCSVQIWESFELNKWLKHTALLSTILLFAMMLKHSRHILHERYYGVLKEGLNEDLQTVTPYLRSIGINANDLVVSMPDPSPNISLYLMNQPGWTEAFTYSDFNIKYFVNNGAKYLVVNGIITNHPEWTAPYMNNLIGEYKGIKIYKLK
jgi:4-amino-4-deoxy-L-arabinose transferase-like glycosyltransferase